ncbi:MAG TPA: hypothetical protein VMT18_07945 [Planctomycetota bacterium]|nr:hypothetical protein [Planctomycetota bacterium]
MKTLALSLLLAASSAARAGDPSPAGAKTDFDPRVHGFDFVNIYQGDILLSVPMVGPVDLGDSSYGLCGGMSFAALDSFYAGLATPDFGTNSSGGPPAAFASGTALRSYVYGRQMDSLRAKDDFLVRRLFSWIPRPIHSNWLVTGLSELTSVAFKEKIAPAIDAGCPVPLCLVKADADDFLPDIGNPTLAPSGFTKNHQVVAIGYRRHTAGPDHWDVDIYDPNFEDEVHTLHLKLRVQTARVRADGTLFSDADDPDRNRRGRFRALFRTPYEEKQPPWAQAGTSSSLVQGRRNSLSKHALGAEEIDGPVEPLQTDGLADTVGELEQRVARLERRRAAEGPAVLCLDVASDLSPLHATRTLPAGVREVSLAVEARAAARFRELTAVFTAVDAGQVVPPGRELARAVQPSAGEQRARFRYSQEQPLPEGRYKVELFGDGAPWVSLPFRVEAQVAAPPTFPLAAGRAWTYDFAQASGAEDPQRATVEIRVAATGPGPAHIELRRDGELVSQEWWSWDARGLGASARILDGERYAMDPVQPLLSANGGVCAWEYGNAQFGAVQKGRQWGPVVLSGPWGEAQGYVVRTEQADGGLVYTAEREFVPELGLVRERIVTARGGRLVDSQELVLRPAAP